MENDHSDSKKNYTGFTRAFHILMPAGFALMILAVLAGVIIVYFGTYYHADVHALAALEDTEAVAVSEIRAENDGANGWFFDGPGADSALVFYPGAKVEAAAYAPLMKDISAGGTDCYLCEMPLNLALLGRDAAETIRSAKTETYDKWYIGGHSLGGAVAAMAADDAEEDGGSDTWDGLILLAAYPTGELSTPVLSIYGSEDEILDPDRYNKTESDGLWPADFTEIIIAGGNHAQFGNYGEQKGDGRATITADMQRNETAEAITGWSKSN